jgi:retinol dehydrogenase 12
MSTRRTALVTGATGAIGKAIARQLARAGFEVVLACRDEAKAKRAADEIRRSAKHAGVRFELVDVSRRASAEALAARFSGPLQLLVNNAAIAPRARQTTPEGIELQLATNVLGYFWLTNALADALAAGAPARVVDVASYWAGGLALDDLEFERRAYGNDAAYRQSKQANRMLSVAQAERLRTRGITVNACHPGDVNSTLSNSLGFGGHESPDDGAETPVWLATSADVEGVTGKYFEHRRESSCRFGADRKAVAALYDACAAR